MKNNSFVGEQVLNKSTPYTVQSVVDSGRNVSRSLLKKTSLESIDEQVSKISTY